MRAIQTLRPVQDARAPARFAEKAEISLEAALGFFCHPMENHLQREGVSDLHGRSSDSLAVDRTEEWNGPPDRREGDPT